MATGDSNFTNVVASGNISAATMVATGAVASTGDGLQLITGDGAATIPASVGIIKVVVLTKGSAAAITLAAPVAGAYGTGDDGKIITFFSETAFAHVVTCPQGFNRKGASGTATASAAANNTFTCIARNGQWNVIANVNFTLA